MNARHKRFVEEYMVDLNAVAAYRRAGYKDSASAYQGAHSLLRKPEIASAIDDAMKTRAKTNLVTVERVLAELATIAFSNLEHYEVDDQGKIKLTADTPPEAIRAVSSIRTRRVKIKDVETVTTEIKLWDKVSALDKLCRHLGLFKPDTVTNNHTHVSIDWASKLEPPTVKVDPVEERIRQAKAQVQARESKDAGSDAESR